MAPDACSPTRTTSTNTVFPKILATRRNPDSQTYSAFLEEAEILDSFANMEAPIRYSFSAPSKRFYCVIALGQITLLSTVVALVLLIAKYETLQNDSERAGYVIWLVFSACATSVFAMTTFIFWHQRRRMRDMQNKLRTMQSNAEAQGSQKRLDTDSSAPPQVRTETDHRQSILAQHHQEASADPTRRRSSIIASGRSRQQSSAAGEGCELSLFQTHLSSGSAERASSSLPSPPPAAVHHRQRDSATSRLFQDDPAMMDLFHSLYSSNSNDDDDDHTPPTPTHRRRPAIDARPRRLSLLLSSPSTTANRSSTALPGLVNTGHDSSPPATPTRPTSPDGNGAAAVLPSSFPLPPTHARFGAVRTPTAAAGYAAAPPASLRWRSLSRRERRAVGEQQQQQQQQKPEERAVWGRMAALSPCGPPSSSSMLRGGDLTDGEMRDGDGVALEQLPSGERRDSHVDVDGHGEEESERSKGSSGDGGAVSSRREAVDLAASRMPSLRARNGSETKRYRWEDGGEEGGVVAPSRRSSRGLASLASTIGEGYARLEEEGCVRGGEGRRS